MVTLQTNKIQIHDRKLVCEKSNLSDHVLKMSLYSLLRLPFSSDKILPRVSVLPP